MKAKVIRTEEQHRAYLERVQALIAKMPKPGSQESEEIELLTVLLEAYENKKYPIETPDPIDAILFRMQEKGLKQADLISYFGTRSRVSEVLAKKRPLTVPMIRALSAGLGISAETLIGLSEPMMEHQKEPINWARFPLQEIVARGWLRNITNKHAVSTEVLMREFISDIDLRFGSASFRRTLNGDAYSPTTKYALYAWMARIVQQARKNRASLGEFDESVLSHSFLRELAQLSWSDSGPLLAIELLGKHGIAVIVEPHLKGTLLDGCALKDVNGSPIIGLTLRHDRLDNFWFTLLHEVAHLWKHVKVEEAFLDDLDASSEDRREVEANRLAREAFIPRAIWKRSDAYISPSMESINRLARELKIHPAIIAGRIRRDMCNYEIFSDLVGYSEVKNLLISSNKESSNHEN